MINNTAISLQNGFIPTTIVKLNLTCDLVNMTMHKGHERIYFYITVFQFNQSMFIHLTGTDALCISKHNVILQTCLFRITVPMKTKIVGHSLQRKYLPLRPNQR